MTANGLEELIDSSQMFFDDADSERRIKYAKEAFFKHGATEEEKRSAIQKWVQFLKSCVIQTN